GRCHALLDLEPRGGAVRPRPRCSSRRLLELLRQAGDLPAWLAPEQVRGLAGAGRHLPAARRALEALRAAGVRGARGPAGAPVGARVAAALGGRGPRGAGCGDREPPGPARVWSPRSSPAGRLLALDPSTLTAWSCVALGAAPPRGRSAHHQHR